MPCHHMAAVAVNGLSLNKFMLMIGGAVILLITTGQSSDREES